MSAVRIQKALAEAGVAGRRTVEEMIVEGRITVNGKLVTSLPCFIDPAVDRVEVDGETVRVASPRKTYFLLNKPRGVLCEQRLNDSRPMVLDLVPRVRERLQVVGGMNASDTGLVILTSDGELAQQLTHPRFGVPKTYVVDIEGRVEGPAIESLKHGVFVDGRKAEGAHVKVVHRSPQHTTLEVVMAEGRGRELRRTLSRLGHRVGRLKRVAFGTVSDRGLKVGNFRPMGEGEIRALRRAVQATVEPPLREEFDHKAPAGGGEFHPKVARPPISGGFQRKIGKPPLGGDAHRKTGKPGGRRFTSRDRKERRESLRRNQNS